MDIDGWIFDVGLDINMDKESSIVGRWVYD